MKYTVCNIEIKKIQLEQLNILREFDHMCKKHDIKYQLMAGTLLGSVRHQGFIPWDDDIDVCLLRDDYERFIDLASKKLDPKYFLQTVKTDQNYLMQYAKIRKNNTLFLEKLSSDLDIHHGVYIDLFPLDNIMPNTLKGAFQQKLLFMIGRMNLTRSKSICLDTENVLSKYTRLFLHYTQKLTPKRWTDNLQENTAMMFKNDKVEYVTHLTNGATKARYDKYMMKKTEFYDLIEGDFEGFRFPIPKNYHDVLSNLFGDYRQLPPENQREPHHGVIKVEL